EGDRPYPIRRLGSTHNREDFLPSPPQHERLLPRQVELQPVRLIDRTNLISGGVDFPGLSRLRVLEPHQVTIMLQDDFKVGVVRLDGDLLVIPYDLVDNTAGENDSKEKHGSG